MATAVLDLYANVLAAWVGATAATLARDAARAVDEVEVLHRLGGALAEAKELEPALGVLTRAARLDPERAALLDTLEKHGWNRTQAAKALGINRTTLYRKMRDLGLTHLGEAG